MYKICAVQAEGNRRKRVLLSLYWTPLACIAHTYCIQAERSNFGMHTHQSSAHNELEDNGRFPNFKLLLVIENAKDMAQIFGSLSY